MVEYLREFRYGIVILVKCIKIDAVETMARVNGKESEMKFHKAAQIHNQ